MKRCPGCGTFYDDDAQQFCEVDGLALDIVPGAEEKEDPFLGTVVDGRYLVQSILGKGGMGAVYKARQTSVGRDIALKVILGETTEDLRGRFMLEAKLTSSLQSVHTVTIFDFGVFEDMLYLAMEYLEGRSLEDMLDEVDQLPWRKCLHIVESIADSLEEAHEKGIIHRDLKPANIHLAKMGSETEFVKVLDFGVAKFIADESHAGLTGTGMIVGTPNYMSPEQARAKPLDARSDLYALGIMLYELLTGVPPFTGEATVDVLLKHVTEAPPPIFDEDLAEPVPAGLRGFLMAMLEKDPDERPQSARAVRDAVKTLLGGGTLEDTYPDPVPGESRTALPPLEVRRSITGEESTLSATVMDTALAKAAVVDAAADLEETPVEPSRKGLGIGLAIAALVVGGVVFATVGGDDAPAKKTAPAVSAPAAPKTSSPAAKAPAPEATKVAAEVPASKPVVKAAAPAPKPPAAPKKLTIHSAPPGATVTLANGLSGVTPLTIASPTAAMTFTLQKPGFLDVKHAVDAGRSGEVRLTLKVDEAAKKAAVQAEARAKAKASKKARKAKARSKAKPKPAVKAKPKKKSARPGLF